MKIIAVLVALLLLWAGVADIYRQKQEILVLDEIVRFIFYVNGEIHYRSPDVESLFESARKQNYSYLTFSGYKVSCHNACDKSSQKEFAEFINRLGTTDTEGQLALCNEYSCRFSEKLNELKINEKSKIQTSAAISLLGSMCVLILLL